MASITSTWERAPFAISPSSINPCSILLQNHGEPPTFQPRGCLFCNLYFSHFCFIHYTLLRCIEAHRKPSQKGQRRTLCVCVCVYVWTAHGGEQNGRTRARKRIYNFLPIPRVCIKTGRRDGKSGGYFPLGSRGDGGSFFPHTTTSDPFFSQTHFAQGSCSCVCV